MAMVVRVTTEKQYAIPGRAAMFAWKPFYTAYLPIPRTDGRYIQNSNRKAELKEFVRRHLASAGYPTNFTFYFEGN